MEELKLFTDLEFTGLNKYTTPISVGIVTPDNKTFYAEITDYNQLLVDAWIRDNVIAKLKFKNYGVYYYNEDNGNVQMKGTKNNVRFYLRKWLSNLCASEKYVQFYADCCHYDFVLLIDILADSALKIPDNVSAYCHDINQDIAKYYKITDREAFNMTREEIISDIKLPDDKHNSLYDAIVAKAIYDKIS